MKYDILVCLESFPNRIFGTFEKIREKSAVRIFVTKLCEIVPLMGAIGAS
jgi:hypothetical protein